MKALTYLFAVMLFTSVIVSCGEPSRDEAHEEVVQDERAENDVVVGIGPEPTEQEIEIVASGMDYQPNEIQVQAGQDLSVALLNQGNEEHNIEFELPSGEQKLPQNVQAGQSEIIEFEAPQKAGTYTFYCPVDDHREKGMEGKLIVVE